MIQITVSWPPVRFERGFEPDCGAPLAKDHVCTHPAEDAIHGTVEACGAIRGDCPEPSDHHTYRRRRGLLRFKRRDSYL